MPTVLKTMISLLNSEIFADWVSMGIAGVLLWLFGYLDKRRIHPIFVPHWLAVLCGRTNGNQVDLHVFTIQMVGLLVFLWTDVLVLLIHSHQQRVFLFTTGFVAVMILGTVFVAIGYVRRT
jgi:hypothetical protein